MVTYSTYTITEVQEGSQIWTAKAAPTTPNYTFAVSNLVGDSDAPVKVGDIVMYSYYRYTVLSISSDESTVLTGNRTSIRGGTGAASTTYSLIVSNLAIIKDKNGVISPTSITLTAKYQTGSSAMANYSGRFKIETTTNNSTWTTQYTSSANEATKEWNVIDGIVAIRCSLYLKDGTTTLLDQQTIPIVSDGIDGTNITITSTSVTYQEGTSGTVKPTGTWGTGVPTVAQGNFLWTKTIVNYSDGSSTESYSVARQGNNGTNGASPTVSSTTVEYQQSTNGKTVPTGTWESTPPTAIAEQFMWTRTTITYSDGATAVSYSVSRNGTNGTSISISSTSVTYQKGTSGTVKPTGTWKTDVQPVGEGEYLWTKTVVTYSDSSKTESYSVSRNAVNGTNGTSPTVTSTVTEYAQSNNGTTTPTSGWDTTPPSTVIAGWFMWARVTVTYSDNATSVSYTVSKNGTNGSNGINTATVYLYKRGTTAPSVPSGNTTYTFSTKKLTGTLDSWSQTIPTTGDGECYVTAAVASSSGTTDTIGTGEWSTPIQFNGTNGTNGTDGTNGLNQATIFLYKRGANVTKPTTSVTYTFSTGALSAEPNSWKRNIPTIDGNPCWVVTATAIGNGTTATITGGNWSDPVKLVEDGADGYTVVLTNENHTFAGNSISAIASEIECNVIAYKGTTQIASTIGTITGQPTGMTTSLLNNGTVNSAFKVTVTTSMATMNGVLTVPVTVDGKTFTKKFTYSLALKGSAGTSENLLMDVYASSLTKVDAPWNRYLSDAGNSTITGQFIAESNLPDPNATHFYRITDSSATTKGRALCFYGSNGTPHFIDGHTYRIGCWVRKHDGSPKIQITLGSYGSWLPVHKRIENTEWEWFEVVHTFGETDASKTTQSDTYKKLYIYFYNNNVAGSSLDMCGFRMEEVQVNSGTARNFILGTEKLVNWNTTQGATISNGIVTFPDVTADTWREACSAKSFKYDLIRNQYVIFSIKVKADSDKKCRFYLNVSVDNDETTHIRQKYFDQYIYFTGNGEWQTVCLAVPIFDYMFNSGSGTVDFDNCWVSIRFGAANNYWNGFQAKEPQLSLGTTATSWTPAPEDIEEEVSNLRTDLQSQIDEKIQTYYQATAPSWSSATDRAKHNGDLWYCTESDPYTGYEEKNVYRYDSTSNTWVAYSATSELFDAVDGKSTIFYGTTSDTFENVDTGDYLVDSVDGSSYRWNGTQWVKVTDYQTAIDNIEIGGRNLLKGSDVAHTSLSGTTVGGTTTQVIPSGTIITLSVQVDADGVVWGSSGNKRIGVASSIPKDSGGTQYIEAWAAMTGRTGNGIDKTFDTSFHGRVKSTYTLQGELPLNKAFNLYVQSVTSGTVSVSRPKLEIGNKATDWTPAPEDVDEAIDNIEIGGRNLIRNSADFDKWVVKNGGANGDIWSRSVSGNTSNVNLRPRTWIGTGYLADYYNKTLTISFEIMSPDWSAIEEGASNTGLNGLAIQLETVDGTPYSSSIGSTGRYFFKRLGDENYFKTDSDLVDGGWVKITSVPLKIDDALWNNSTTLIDGYDYFTFSFILRRNGTVSFRKPQIEIGTKATDWTLAPEDIIVGKNLIPLSKNLKSFTPENLTRSTVTYTDDSCTITNTYGDVRYGVYYDVDVKSGSTYTLSFQASNVSGTNINYGVGNRTPDQTASWNTITGGYKDVINGSNVCTFTIPDTVTKVRIYFGAGSLNGTMTISNLKLEVGNRATEWTSAPEDIQYAMKVATNYLSADSTGIMIADLNDGEQTPSEATGRNVFIDNDSVDIRNGTSTLASFTGDNTKFYDPIYSKELAVFGTNGAIIGAENEQRFVIERDAIKSINDNGATVFSVNSTSGTVVTEAQVASGGESSYYPSSKTVVFDTVGTGFTTNTTFYTKKLTAIIRIRNSAKPLTNVKVNSVAATSTLVDSYSGYWYSSTHSIDLSPFSFAYGTSKSATYQITASFVNDYGDSYNLTAHVSIDYDGNVTLTVQALNGECVRTSGNNEDIATMDLLGSKIIYDVIYQSSAYTKAPSMTFGTRGKNAIMAPFSVTIGEDLYANNDNQLSIGRYNINNDEFFPLAFVVGNGRSDLERSNAFSVDWSGNTIVEGNLEVNGELLSNIGVTKLNDCNDGIDPRKYYYLDGSGTNKPTTAWTFLRCFEISGNNVVQIASIMNSTDPYMYLRSRNSSGTWSSWKTFSMAGHKHAASDITSGTLSIARGGTGSTGTTYTETIADVITKGTNITISNARYAQWGKIAQVSLVLKTTAALSGNTVVATLVSGKCPKTFSGATVNYNGTGIIYTNGSIHVNQSYASGTTLNIESTYILP